MRVSEQLILLGGVAAIASFPIPLSASEVAEGTVEDFEIGEFDGTGAAPPGAVSLTAIVNNDAGGQVKLGLPDGFTIPFLTGATKTDFETEPTPAYQFTFQYRDGSDDPVGDPIVWNGLLTVLDRPDIVITNLTLSDDAEVGTPAWTVELSFPGGTIVGTPLFELGGTDAADFDIDTGTGDGETAGVVTAGTKNLTLAVSGITPAAAITPFPFTQSVAEAPGIDAPAISTPVGVLPNDNTPDVFVDPDETGALDGDTIRYAIRPLDGPGGDPTDDWDDDYVVTVWPDVSEPFTVEGVGVLPDGYYLRRVRFERDPGGENEVIGDWSSEQEFYVDTAAPEFDSSTPADDAVDIAVDADIIIVCSEPVQAGVAGKTIRVYDASDDSLIESFDVGTEEGTDPGEVEFDGTNVILDMTDSLPADAAIYVKWDEGAILDLAGNPIAENDTETLLNFTTAAAGPTLVQLTAYSSANFDNSQELVLPSGITAGNILIAVIKTGNGGTINSVPSGWTLVDNDDTIDSPNLFRVYKKTAAGTEGGTTIAWGFTGSVGSAYVFAEVDAPLGEIEVTFTNALNPPSHTHSGGSAPTVWIAVSSCRRTTSTVSTAPTNYGGFAFAESDTNSGNGTTVSIAGAHRTLEAATEDPGTFNWASTIEGFVSCTISVR